MHKFLKFLTFFSFFVCTYLFFSATAFAAIIWNETQPAGDVNKFWDSGAMSEDGSTIVAITQNTAVYLSTDSGNNWSEVKPRGLTTATQWQTTAVSSDGQVIAVGGQNGMYISTDQGGSWTQVLSGADASNFTSVSMSPDGQYLIGGSYGGRLYTSTTSGSSWTERQPAGNVDKSWQTVGISGDGQFMLAGVLNGRLYKSIDGGSNWNEIQPAGNIDKDWFVSIISSDGLNAFAGVSGGRLYRSTDLGSNWNEVQPAGNINISWNAGDISYEGGTILLGAWGGRMYISQDSGDSWSETQPAGAVNKNWWVSAVSGDAEKFLAGYYTNGRLFLGSNPTPTPTVTPSPTQSPNSSSTTNNSNPCPGFVVCPNVNSSNESIQDISPNEGGGSILIQPMAGFMQLNIAANNQSFESLLSGNSLVPVPWSQGINTVGNIINFTAKSAFNGYPVTSLPAPATIMLNYDPTKLGGKSPQSLRLGWFNPSTKRWQILNNNTVVKPEENLVANTSTNLGYYTVVLPNSRGAYSPVLGEQANNKITQPVSINPSIQNVSKKLTANTSVKSSTPEIKKQVSSKKCVLFICW